MRNAITNGRVRLPDHLDVDRPTTRCGKVCFGMYKVEPTIMTAVAVIYVLAILCAATAVVTTVGGLHTKRDNPSEGLALASIGGGALGIVSGVCVTAATGLMAFSYKSYRQDVRERTFTA